MTPFVRMRALSMEDPGSRLRLTYTPPDDHALLTDEHVRLAAIDNPDATHVAIRNALAMSRADAEWLRAALDELLREMP